VAAAAAAAEQQQQVPSAARRSCVQYVFVCAELVSDDPWSGCVTPQLRPHACQQHEVLLSVKRPRHRWRCCAAPAADAHTGRRGDTPPAATSDDSKSSNTSHKLAFPLLTPLPSWQ
jgi:hypothetical protein